MDELTSVLASSFQVSNEPNSTSAPHPRYASYKQKTSNNDQESRRQRLLEIQKSNRFNFTNHVRKLTDNHWENEDLPSENTKEGTTDPNDEETMDVDIKLKKPGRFYKDQLMLSEWFVEVPEDFKTEWMTVLCPVAKRCLIVASRGNTKMFTKSGYRLNSFPSHLPGGAKRCRERDSTILDCLYNEVSQTFYVLDLMCWNGHPVYDTETEFRFYWMHEKFQENKTLGEISSSNPYKFVPLPSFRCETNDILNAIEAATFEIDGVLFFHKRSHYTFGSTPLVVWLKPYMLPEIVGIPVPERQMGHKPEGYTNYADHMKQVEEDKQNAAKRKGNRTKGKTPSAMNCEIEMKEEDSQNAAKRKGKGKNRTKGKPSSAMSCEIEMKEGDAEVEETNQHPATDGPA